VKVSLFGPRFGRYPLHALEDAPKGAKFAACAHALTLTAPDPLLSYPKH